MLKAYRPKEVGGSPFDLNHLSVGCNPHHPTDGGNNPEQIQAQVRLYYRSRDMYALCVVEMQLELQSINRDLCHLSEGIPVPDQRTERLRCSCGPSRQQNISTFQVFPPVTDTVPHPQGPGAVVVHVPAQHPMSRDGMLLAKLYASPGPDE
jgi:hypothetical protein